MQQNEPQIVQIKVHKSSNLDTHLSIEATNVTHFRKLWRTSIIVKAQLYQT